MKQITVKQIELVPCVHRRLASSYILLCCVPPLVMSSSACVHTLHVVVNQLLTLVAMQSQLNGWCIWFGRQSMFVEHSFFLQQCLPQHLKFEKVKLPGCQQVKLATRYQVE